MLRLHLLVALTLLPAPAADAGVVRSSIFYYPWYGTPASDGGFQQWQQRGHRPPATIAAAYFPARGVYSSSGATVVEQHMAEIERAGIDQVSISWWGRGSTTDLRLPAVAWAARAAGLDVAVHLEPYGGRTAASVEADIAYLRGFGATDFYVYRPDELPAAEWAELNDRLRAPVRTFAQTGLVGLAAAGGFDGVYTYDILTYGPAKLVRFCAQARRRGLLCAPSVGPGYDARRAVGDARVVPRRAGATYDLMWRAALRSRPHVVTITSYNEWLEGTQIEPARARPGYRSYDGAWGLHGAAAETAYLDRTRFWTDRLASVQRRR